MTGRINARQYEKLYKFDAAAEQLPCTLYAWMQKAAVISVTLP